MRLGTKGSLKRPVLRLSRKSQMKLKTPKTCRSITKSRSVMSLVKSVEVTLKTGVNVKTIIK